MSIRRIDIQSTWPIDEMVLDVMWCTHFSDHRTKRFPWFVFFVRLPAYMESVSNDKVCDCLTVKLLVHVHLHDYFCC